MKQSPSILMLLLLSFFTMYGQSNNTNEGARQKVMQLERDVVKAFIAGDKTKIDHSFANDYKGYYQGYPENKETALKNVTPLPGITIRDMKMDARVYGTSAVVEGILEIKVGNEKPGYRRFMDVLIQQKDGWKIVASEQSTVSVWNVRDMEDSELVTVSAQDCEAKKTVKSLNDDVRTFLRFKNNTSEKVTAYWINYAGQKDTSAGQAHQIAPGKSVDVYTYFTHPFIVIGSSQKCYGIYETGTSGSIAIIKD